MVGRAAGVARPVVGAAGGGVFSAGAAAARRWAPAQGTARPCAIAVLAEADLEEEERNEADSSEREQRQAHGLAGHAVPRDRQNAAEDHGDYGGAEREDPRARAHENNTTARGANHLGCEMNARS